MGDLGTLVASFLELGQVQYVAGSILTCMVTPGPHERLWHIYLACALSARLSSSRHQHHLSPSLEYSIDFLLTCSSVWLQLQCDLVIRIAARIRKIIIVLQVLKGTST